MVVILNKKLANEIEAEVYGKPLINRKLSNCCFENIIEPDICSKCKEHCSALDEDYNGERQEEFCN